jgi:glycosyltransferase involved in cell wall biosynthesis
VRDSTDVTLGRIAVVARGSQGEIDAILDHAHALSEALAAAGASPELVLRQPDGSWLVGGNGHARLAHAVRGVDVVVLQYNPFLWGRRGIAPWLPVEAWRIRRSQTRPRVILVVHETYLRFRLPWRNAAMSLWQQLQLRALRPAADVVFVSIEPWTRKLAAMRPKRPTYHMASPSNLPDFRHERDTGRRRLDAEQDELVVATFTGGDRTRHVELVDAALRALAAAGHRTVLVALGSGGAAPEPLPAGIRLVRPGYLPDTELAHLLAAADIFLAPFDDGVSTRRGSLMAALQHGLPVVGTQGFLTDSLWADTAGAVTLTPVDRPDEFARAVVQLAADADLRRAAGKAARALYESSFDWPRVVAAIVVEADRR